MNRVEIKNLPNDVKLSAYFNNSQKKSIQKIEALKTIYVKPLGKIEVEEKSLILSMEKVEKKNITFREQILFNGKEVGPTEYYYMYAYSPQKFDKQLGQCKDYKWARVEKNPTLLQVWNNPMGYERLKQFVGLFYGFNKEKPVDFSLYEEILTEEYQDIESLDIFLKVAKKDRELGPYQEYDGYNERYFNRFTKSNCR